MVERLPDFEGLALFVKITEAGSISAVSREVGLPKSTVSKRLLALEERLGVQLINRTTRRMSLTDAGRNLFERAGRAVRDIAAIEQDVVSRTGLVEGRIRLVAPVAFGQVVLLPLLRKFLALYPAVSLEMSFSDQPVDMVAERFDLMVKCGPLEDTSLIARHLRDCRRMIVASPDYLATAPALTALAHIRLHYAVVLNEDDGRWTFEGDEVTTIHVRSRLALNSFLAVHRAAIDGLGLAVMPDYLVADDIACGRLVHVVPAAEVSPVPTSLFYPASHVQSPAVRKTIEFLVSELRTSAKGATPATRTDYVDSQ